MLKKTVFIVGAIFFGWSLSAWAGSIDYLSNQSADYMRTFSRNASTQPDAVNYNPAGTAMMAADGMYLSFSSQTILKNYRITYKGEDYTADNPTPILPSLYLNYKWRHLAIFGAFTVPAGGGSLTYEKGVPYLIPLALAASAKPPPLEGKFEGSSLYMAGTVGAAYEFYNMISVSAAARVVYGHKTYKGYAVYNRLDPAADPVRAELDTKKSALGVGGIFGIHLRPLPELNIGIRFETETPLEFEAETESQNIAFFSALTSFEDGAKEKRNLPSLLGLGVSYAIIPRLVASISFNYYLINQADSGTDTDSYVIGYDDDYDNGMDLGGALEFEVIPSLWVSAGYNRAFLGGNKNTYYDFEYAIDAHSFGTGAKYSLLDDRLGLTLAFSGTFYDEAKNVELLSKDPETFDKTVYAIALGAEYRFF